MNHLETLKRYWNYDEFRPLQADIITSISSGKDTLGLMPTGGGKSLTFQVPTMSMEGTCIVITPLIALMKDQVENLKAKNIKAAAIFSGMTHNDILRTLDNTIYGAYKFLYVSPERLTTEIFIQKITQATVCMIAVDESHCISQWGYDFRPSYLRIADFRTLLPNVPVLALTATATPEVVTDIQKQLHFATPNVFQTSFYRSNLAYVVRTVENKEAYLLKILEKVPGSSVVYVRNRKRTKEIAEYLTSHGIAAENFHAGLKNETKDTKQAKWKTGETRVIVSTNAFGMGIDKSNVRTVIHMDLPDSLEAYFQEAGRAGRDGKKAFAVTLYNTSDATKLRKRTVDNFPNKEMIAKVYDALGNYLQVAIKSGMGLVFPFDIGDFCTKFKLPILTSYNCLKLLEQAEYIELTDEQDSASMVLFTVHKDELYKLQHTKDQEKLIHILLRSYTGLFTDFAAINEETISKRLEWSRDYLYQTLVGLAKEGVIHYIPRKKTPFISWTRQREDSTRIVLSKEVYEIRRDKFIARINQVLDYTQNESRCRSQLLLAYFGEKNTKACGSCDNCQKNKETLLVEEDFNLIHQFVLDTLHKHDITTQDLFKGCTFKEQKILQVIRQMMDHNEVHLRGNLLSLVKSNS
jgi:ATP-dependent DNA helicase RecQ